MSDLCWLPATELAALIRARKLWRVELTEALLARIERLNPTLNAFCAVTADVARQGAKIAEAAIMHGEPLGAVHGVPVSIKDVLFTRGIVTTGGSRMFADFVPEEDAIAVERLKAAVAAGLGPLALGTDGGGSIRIPAAFCGVYGFKPSFGRIPSGPGFPGWETFTVPAPMTRTVRDAALMLDVLAGPDDRDRHSLPAMAGSYLAACDEPIQGWSVAWSPDLGYAQVEPEVIRLTEEAAGVFEALGCRVETVATGWENPEETFATMAAAEMYANWGDRLPEWRDRMDRTLVRFLERGGGVTIGEYLRAARRRREFWLEAQGFLARFDLLLTPTVPVPPFAGDGSWPREIAGEEGGPPGWGGLPPLRFAWVSPTPACPWGFRSGGAVTPIARCSRRRPSWRRRVPGPPRGRRWTDAEGVPLPPVRAPAPGRGFSPAAPAACGPDPGRPPALRAGNRPGEPRRGGSHGGGEDRGGARLVRRAGHPHGDALVALDRQSHPRARRGRRRPPGDRDEDGRVDRGRPGRAARDARAADRPAGPAPPRGAQGAQGGGVGDAPARADAPQRGGGVRRQAGDRGCRQRVPPGGVHPRGTVRRDPRRPHPRRRGQVSLHLRLPRSRADHPHLGRGAPLRLHALAERVQRVLLLRRPLAGLPQDRLPPCHPELPAPAAALRPVAAAPAFPGPSGP